MKILWSKRKLTRRLPLQKKRRRSKYFLLFVLKFHTLTCIFRFFSFKKKTPTKEAEEEPAAEEPQGLYDTEAESKSSESAENKITVHTSQDEVRENVEPQPVVLSPSASSSSASATSPIAADMDLSPKESIMSPDRNNQYKPLPAHDVPTPLPAEKFNTEEESVEDVTPASPKSDELEDVPMDKPLSPRSEAPTDDIVSPKAQSIAEAASEDKVVQGQLSLTILHVT